MLRPQNRKTTPGVKDGQVQKKNRHAFTSHQRCVIDRKSPGKGYRHVLSKRDVRDFLSILPQWNEVSELIESIILIPGDGADFDGLYEHFDREQTGMILLPAWEKDLWIEINDDYFDQHRHIYDRINLAYEQVNDGWECRFTLAQAKAYMLLHILLHELGHHVYRLRHKNRLLRIMPTNG